MYEARITKLTENATKKNLLDEFFLCESALTHCGHAQNGFYQNNLTEPLQLDPQNPFFAAGTSIYEALNDGQSTNRFYYDKDDRLTGAEYSKGISIAYQYDGNGNLVRQTTLSRAAETNGLPVLWLFQHGLPNIPGIAYVDSDSDGWSNYQEWKGDSNPVDPQSAPSLVRNSGESIASQTLPFIPKNFVVGTGDVNGLGAQEIVIGGDGPVGTNSNYLTLLTQTATGWESERIEVGQFGVTSITVGQATNRPYPAIYAGLRQTDGAGRIIELEHNDLSWVASTIALATNEAAFVGGILETGAILALVSTNGNQLCSLMFTNESWNRTEISDKLSAGGLPSHGSLFSHILRDSSLRLIEGGQIEVIAGEREAFKDEILLPTNIVENSATTKLYFKAPQPSSRDSAESYFSGYHGHLVTIGSVEENLWVASHFPGQAWIGLHWVRDGGYTFPTWADGTRAPSDNTGIPTFGFWDQGAAGLNRSDGMCTAINFTGTVFIDPAEIRGKWYDYPPATMLNAIGEVRGPIATYSNQWVFSTSPLRIVWPSYSLQVARMQQGDPNRTSIIDAYVRDDDATQDISQGDAFILTRYGISGNVVTTTIQTNRIGTGSTAQSYALAALDFLSSGVDTVFTAEPNGEIYSWSATNTSDPLKRQLFSADYSGKAWHDLSGVKMAAGGQGLVGLMIDPTNQNICNVIFWPPQPVLAPLPDAIPQTAPLARILPDPNSGGSISSVPIRIWDAEGNASIPYLSFSLDGRTTWTNATIRSVDSSTYSATLGVTALPGGMNHVIEWNVVQDLGPNVVTNVQLRVRAQDVTLLGDWSEPMPFHVETTSNPDRDGDGLPNEWETRYGLNPDDPRDANIDSDGDGYTNLQEYISGTDPRDPNSVLRITVGITDGTLNIRWTAGTNAFQILQQAADITMSWTDIYTNSPGGLPLFTVPVVNSTTAAEFYRIRLERR